MNFDERIGREVLGPGTTDSARQVSMLTTSAAVDWKVPWTRRPDPGRMSAPSLRPD